MQNIMLLHVAVIISTSVYANLAISVKHLLTKHNVYIE